MFYELPAETVFEAKERTKRATFYFFILLVSLYVFFLDLLVLTGYIWSINWFRLKNENYFFNPLPVIEIASLAAVVLAVFHFYRARAKTLDELLNSLGAKEADTRDEYHSQFIRIVQEAEAATGIHGIRAVVLPSTGCNAFSLQDGKNQCAIGVTEGLLSKLTRPELSAVIAHEAAHLVHEDSRLVTTACFLVGFFGSTKDVLSRQEKLRVSTYDRRSSSRSGGIWEISIVLWIISSLGYLATKLVFMAISREREYLADADGVQMCKDPFSLAESLYKISRRYRGETPENFASLFIMNPSGSGLDEKEGFFSELFSTHPPISKRLENLLSWAKSDLPTMEEMVQNEEKPASQPKESSAAPSTAAAAPAEPTGFMAYQGDQWVGPYNPQQLLSLGLLQPATWICAAGTQEVSRASDLAQLLPLFQQQVSGSVTTNGCPRCKVALLKIQYEGTEVEQCSFCKGYLLRAGVLERLISREEVAFAAEDIKKAKIWRDSQRGDLKSRGPFPEIKCPHCQSLMCVGIHSMLTQVVIDHCTNEKCGAIWCDGGELETIQMMIEEAHKAKS